MGTLRVLEEFEVFELSSLASDSLTHRDRAGRACTASEAGNTCFSVVLCPSWQKSSSVLPGCVAECTWCDDIRQLDVQ